MNLIRACALTLALAVPTLTFSQTAPDPGPTAPALGGCWKSGICFGPVLTVSMLGVDLKSGKIVGSFMPSAGYGFKWHSGKWDEISLAPTFTFQTGPSQALLLGGSVTFLRWASIGGAYQIIGEVSRPLLLFGMAVPLP